MDSKHDPHDTPTLPMPTESSTVPESMPPEWYSTRPLTVPDAPLTQLITIDDPLGGAVTAGEQAASPPVSESAVAGQIGALVDVNKQLAILCFATEALRPFVESVDPDESQDDRWRRRHREFYEAWNAFVAVLEQTRLFFPLSIYREFLNVARLARVEALSFKRDIESTNMAYMPTDGHERAQQHLARLHEALDALQQCVQRAFF